MSFPFLSEPYGESNPTVKIKLDQRMKLIAHILILKILISLTHLNLSKSDFTL